MQDPYKPSGAVRKASEMAFDIASGATFLVLLVMDLSVEEVMPDMADGEEEVVFEDGTGIQYLSLEVDGSAQKLVCWYYNQAYPQEPDWHC